MRIEAAALHGTPVAFLVSGPWTTPWRQAEATPAGAIGIVAIYSVIALAVLIGGSVLARQNLRAGRGDRRGALTFGFGIAAALWALWLCEVHVAPSVGLVGVALLAVVTTVFYTVLFWAVYLAVEPFVRRYWPRTLMSWTTVLRGNIRDPIVGRDVLFGVALGLAVVLLIRATTVIAWNDPGWPSVDLLRGLRAAVGEILESSIYSVRTSLLVFFMLFLLRVFLRHQWLAAVAFASLFGLANALDSRQPMVDFAVSFVYFGLFAVATVRWGFTTLVVSVLVANVLLNMPVTAHLSSWWLPYTALTLAIPLALATWGLYRSVGGRLFHAELL
jgi:serine/threonine-protein kinase